ncbi:MAG: UDP-4-amino-4,6-dideoxy-N-acetyl-beta-L-altrosamine transaminase [Lentimicrobiaceae bacterium]|nr:UDP-4-amino-4,6-dideoxy-N-acetyl-beta-L-altrosamine transaminase [Lentimicrobiaceae bacterium]
MQSPYFWLKKFIAKKEKIKMTNIRKNKDPKDQENTSDNASTVHRSPFTANPIPYGRQNITEEDIQAVIETLKSDYLTQGPKVKEFEDAFARYIGCKYAVAVANGTAALHLCTLALDVKSGDKVITTPITFAASANCVRYAGGDVVFADIDHETYLLDIKKVEALLSATPKGIYKGIIPVDFAGRAVNLEEYRKLAEKYGCWIIEDACHAPGGYFIDSNGQKQNCGNGQFADLAIFSFHPVKHIACGEGGMITTNNEELYKKLLALRTHGIIKDTEAFQNSPATAYGKQQITSVVRMTNDSTVNDAQSANDYPGWYYEMQSLGYNYRITDFQAALGTSQLNRADSGLERRKKIAQAYNKAFSGKPYIKGQSGAINGHAYHLYVIEVENRKGLYEYLRSNDIFAQIHYVPVHLMPYYKQFGWNENDLPNAEYYYSQCISLPMYPTLTNEEQSFVISCIDNFYNNN